MSEARVTGFLPLSRDSDPGRWIPQVLPWLREAGEPYHSWFFGGIASADRVEAILRGWMQRRSSELAVERAVLLVSGDRVVGGFIALGGADLQGCRRADTLAALQAAGRDGRGRLAERLRVSQHLFAGVATDEFYLSRLGVATAFRRAGHGARILQEYLGTGVTRGFRRFRLDVSAENRPAVELYLAFGFKVIREASDDRAGMAYLNMALELGEDADFVSGPVRRRRR